MAISPELFRAILAMDSYNRGYGAGNTPKIRVSLDSLPLTALRFGRE
jgi:hypothetical protein